MSAHVVGRLKPGITLSQAKADMDLVARNLAAAFPVADKAVGITLVSMKEDLVGTSGQSCWCFSLPLVSCY